MTIRSQLTPQCRLPGVNRTRLALSSTAARDPYLDMWNFGVKPYGALRRLQSELAVNKRANDRHFLLEIAEPILCFSGSA